jgi:hypothetical protein
MPDSWPNNPVERTAHSAGLVPMRGSVPVGRRSPMAFVVSLFLISSHGAHYLISRYAGCMHVISRKMLCQFWAQYPESKGALAQWFNIRQGQDFMNVEALHATFPTADKDENFIFVPCISMILRVGLPCETCQIEGGRCSGRLVGKRAVGQTELLQFTL